MASLKRSSTRRLMNKVQIHWVNSPSSPSDPSEQFQFAHDIEDLIQDRFSENIDVRMVDPRVENLRLLRDDCVATVLVLAIADTKLDKDNARIVNHLLEERHFVFLVLKGLSDGNITRFGIGEEHANDVVVYDLDKMPKATEPGCSAFDMLVHMIEKRLEAVFNDYPVDNFAMLLQQRRDAELKQERRSWTLLLLSLIAMAVLGIVFTLVAHFTALEKIEHKAVLDNAADAAKTDAQLVSSQLATLEEQYVQLSKLKEDREFYSNSLSDDYITLILGLGDLELTEWDFEAEQYFMGNRVQELNSTTAKLCALLGDAVSTIGSESDDLAQWARFVSYCENLHSLQTCDTLSQGDGTCDGKNNYHDCGWDGGDCCPGQHCLDGSHVCDEAFWHHLDRVGECMANNCTSQFGFFSYVVSSDGIDRYTPSCTSGKQATELVFLAELPPGGLVEMRIDTIDDEVPIFIESYLVDDAYTACPVEGSGSSPGTGPNFVRCSEERYVLLEADASATTSQHAFFVVDVEDVTPMELTVMWRNTTAAQVADNGASEWARAQICEIGHNKGLVGDGTCHPTYDSASCSWDGGDCRCVFGQPSTESFGDGTCDVRLLDVWTNTRSCGWDGGDCAVGNDRVSGGAISNLDKPRFNNSEILDNYTVLPVSSAPETLNITRHDRAPGAQDEEITLVALPRCQEPDEWICPHEWYNGNNYVTYSEYYELELSQVKHTTCPATPASLTESQAHFQNGLAICDCGCGAVDPDCTVDGTEVECGNYANIDPLTLRFDPEAPEESVPDTCVCVTEDELQLSIS